VLHRRMTANLRPVGLIALAGMTGIDALRPSGLGALLRTVAVLSG
jgi:hypothetical protein